MEEALAVTLGLGAIAVSPFIPGVRPVARKAIASGLAAADAVTRAAAVAGEHWKDLVAEARAEREAAAAEADRVEVDAETIVISKP
jgi:Protein of unknown function (DUF5132)